MRRRTFWCYQEPRQVGRWFVKGNTKWVQTSWMSLNLQSGSVQMNLLDVSVPGNFLLQNQRRFHTGRTTRKFNVKRQRFVRCVHLWNRPKTRQFLKEVLVIWERNASPLRICCELFSHCGARNAQKRKNFYFWANYMWICVFSSSNEFALEVRAWYEVTAPRKDLRLGNWSLEHPKYFKLTTCIYHIVFFFPGIGTTDGQRGIVRWYTAARRPRSQSRSSASHHRNQGEVLESQKEESQQMENSVGCHEVS